MLKTPSAAQPCSSSPISGRVASVDSVVLPVPERPKNTATRSSSPTLAEQCIESTPAFGSRSFMSVKIDFLISPAYSVPPIRMRPSERCSTTKLAARVPSVSGTAWKCGAWSTTASGRWAAISSSVGSMNRLRANSACQALSVTTRSARRCCGWAPAKASITNSSRDWR